MTLLRTIELVTSLTLSLPVSIEAMEVSKM